jgi:LDH2 family malate/lactate/ureidoglycolate dehydrogenase
MDTWIRTFRDAKAVEGKKVIIPGDPEREAEIIRMAQGIPLMEDVVKDLKDLGEQFGIAFL